MVVVRQYSAPSATRMELACALKEPLVKNVMNVVLNIQVKSSIFYQSINPYNAGEIPNCERCPVCFDSGLEIINELSANIMALMLRLDQLYSARAPLDDINDIISELDYQLIQAEYAIENMMINRSDVTLIENKANSVS